MPSPKDYSYFENINIGIQVISPEMKYLFLNKALLSEISMSKEEIVGFHMSEKFPGVEKTDIYRKIQHCMKTGEDQSLINEFVYEGNKRAFYDLRMHAVPEGVIIFTSDVTDSKEGEKLLQESNELLEEKVRLKTLELEDKNRQLEIGQSFYRSILDTLPFGMHLFSLNQKGELIFESASKAADDILGIDHQLLFGKTIEEAFPNIEQTGIPDKFRKIAKDGGNYQEINIDYENDEYAGVYENFNFQLAENQVISFFRDITQQKQIEDNLRQKQKMEAIGVMTGGVAHEFNNLLMPVIGYSDILFEQSTDPNTKDKLQKIIKAADRASKLIKSMLAFSRQSQEPQEPIMLSHVVENTLSFIGNTIPKDIKITKRLPNEISLVKGVSNDIQQVLINLILNACHAMPTGGDIYIQLTDAKEYAGLDGNYIELKVRDNGDGIPHEIMDKIFDPFFTTKEKGRGTGLGLSVVEGVVEQHKGHIKIDSEKGNGTTFKLYFPALETASSESTDSPEDKPRGLGRLMVVDDEEDIIDLVTQNLIGEGYSAEGFTDCEKALQTYSVDPYYFDAVIIDYGMPHMNGKELAIALRQQREDIKIVLMTGYGKLISEQDIDAWGIDKSILKPFKFEALKKLIDDLLKTKQE